MCLEERDGDVTIAVLDAHTDLFDTSTPCSPRSTRHPHLGTTRGALTSSRTCSSALAQAVMGLQPGTSIGHVVVVSFVADIVILSYSVVGFLNVLVNPLRQTVLSAASWAPAHSA